MMRSLLSMMSLLFLVSCASLELPNVCPYITLPGSGDGYCKYTVTQEPWRVLKVKWDEDKKKTIHLTAHDWAKIKVVLLRQCASQKCKQTVSSVDELFLGLDSALESINIKP